jgi:O-antigen/teichoic acid export membrane protein
LLQSEDGDHVEGLDERLRLRQAPEPFRAEPQCRERDRRADEDLPRRVADEDAPRVAQNAEEERLLVAGSAFSGGHSKEGGHAPYRIVRDKRPIALVGRGCAWDGNAGRHCRNNGPPAFVFDPGDVRRETRTRPRSAGPLLAPLDEPRQGGRAVSDEQEASGRLSAEEAERLTFRARIGMVILAARTIVLQLLVLGANVLLARVLDPGDFGVFAIVQFVLVLSNLFGDAGLGGALVQQKEEPTQGQLSTVFWVHVGIVGTLIAGIWFAAPYAPVVWRSLPEGSAWLIRALSFSLLFSFLRAVPTIVMERNLQFGRLSILEVLNSTVFYVVVVTLALSKMRVWSLIAGVVAQSLVVLVVTYAMRPWRPSLVFERAVLGPMIRFGLPFTLKGIINFFNEAVMPVYAGSLLGKERLGYVNWGRNTAYFPLKLVEIVGRVSFPLYSRLRSDPVLLVREIEKNVKICVAGTLFFVGLVYGVGPDLVSVIYGTKWMPALGVVYVFTLAISIGFVSPIIGAAFDAIGEPQIFVRLSIAWTLVNWGSVVLGTSFVSDDKRLLAFAISYSVHVVFGNVAVLYVMRKKFPRTRMWPRVRASIVAALVTALVGRFAMHPFAGSIPGLIVAVVLSFVVFWSTIGVLDPTARDDLRSLFRRREPPKVEELPAEVIAPAPVEP